MSKHKNNSILTGIVIAGALFSGAAHASTVLPSLSGSVVVSEGSTTNVTWTFSDTYTDNGDGTFTYTGVNGSQTVWAFEWNITVNPDPFINSALTITNNTAFTKHFDVLFTLPVGTPFAPGLKSGNAGVTFQDWNGNGLVSLSNVNWSGRIDGADAMSLYTLDAGSCGPGSPGCISMLSPVSDGPNLHSAGVSTSIGIHLSFDLSGGDRASFNNFFEVVPVPLPAAVWLFSAGLGLLSVVARKKK